MKRIWIVLALATLAFVYAVLVGRSVVKAVEVSEVQQKQTPIVSNFPAVNTHSATNQLSADKPATQQPGFNQQQRFTRLVQNAPVIARDEKVDQGRIVRKTVYETEFKYPLVLIEETFEIDAAGEEKWVEGVAKVANHVMVRFPENTTKSDVQQWAGSHGFSLLKKLRTTDLWLIQTSEADVDALDCLLATCETGSSSERKIVAEADYLLHLSAMPNDPFMGTLWGLHNTGQTGGVVDADIDALEAWDITTGSRQIRVGVIDSGVDYTHPDLAANMWSNPNEIAGNGIDDDNNGFIDDVHGWDFYSGDNDPMDESSHGTHCAGTIGAVGDNGIGVVGVAREVSLVAIRLFGSNGFGSLSDAIDAVNYGTKAKVVATSNSWGRYHMSGELHAAIINAGESNILFVAAAGNGGSDLDRYLHLSTWWKLDNVIMVAASDWNDNKAGFSSYGLKTVDLAAPGTSISSTVPGGEYAGWGGTSTATPHVSGTIALLKSYMPSLSAREVKQLLLDTVDPLPSFEGICVSGGRLNVRNALKDARGPVIVQLPEEATEGDGVLINACTLLFPEAVPSNVVIELSSSDPSELLVPSNIVVLAGTTSTVFSVEVLDDNLLDGSRYVEVVGHLEGHPSRAAIMRVHDSETATLQLTLPSYTFEGGSQFSGAVSVCTPPDKKVEVLLRSSDPTEIASGRAYIYAGQTMGFFYMEAVDDNLFDGIQSATITAHVENWANDCATMQVYDNEDARLYIEVPAMEWEGKGVLTNAGVVWVPGIVTSDMQVALISSDTSEIIVPSSVTIQQGRSSASFDITIVDDNEADGRQRLNITATAPDFISAVNTMEVTDNELDYFFIGPIGTQSVGEAFVVVVIAQNIDDERLVNYTGMITLNAIGDAGSLSIVPDTGEINSDGHWVGEVVINDIDNNVVLIADNGAGTQGTSIVFNVTGSQIFITSDTLANTFVVANESVTRTMIISNGGNVDLEFEVLDNTPSTNELAHYPSSISTNGLEAYYPFSGNANDESGNEYHGIVSGVTLTTDRFKKSDRAYHFDGNNDVINMRDVLDRKGSNWTCSAWIRIQDYNQDSTVFSKGLVPMGAPPNSGFGMYVLGGTRPEDTLRFTIGTDQSGIVGSAEYPLSALPKDEYIFLSGVYERGPTSAIMRLYINGTQVASNSCASGDSNSNMPFLIGASFFDNQSYFRGDIDDVRMYSRALFPSEIMELYNEGNPDGTYTWLATNPLVGAVPAGDSMPIAVMFDAEGMTAGTHISNVVQIVCNDIFSSTNTYPVSMWVLPSTPTMIEEPQFTPGSSNDVSWMAVRGPVDYLVEAATSTSSASDQQSGWITARNHTFEGLSANTLYFYRVKASALSSIGQLEGNWSDWVQSVQEADLGDADNDSLPNWWEQIYFGGVSNCNPLLDFDGDGVINLHEYIAGADPTNAWSIFKVEGVDTSIEGTFEIWWDSIAGRVYSIYWKENMTNAFQLLEADIRYPRNSYMDYIHSSDGKGFYTIDVKLEE